MLALSFAATESASAQYYYQQPVYVVPAPAPQNHDAGLMFRLTIGGGYFTAPDRGAGGNRIFGGTLIYDMAIGGSIVPNVALAFDTFGLYAISPNVELNDGTTGSASSNVAFVAAALGGSITFWMMPHNIYVTGAVGFALAWLEDFYGPFASTDLGVGFNAMIGKEWWIGPYLGFGLAAQVMYMTMPDSGGRLDVFSPGLALSFTYQ